MTKKITIEIDNITDSQIESFEEFFRLISSLSNVGTSRWLSFFVDADNNSSPTVKIDGVLVDPREKGKDKTHFIKSGSKFLIDENRKN